MKFISWNVNGFRALQRKMDVYSWLVETGADALCIQETKMHRDQVQFETPGYFQYWNEAVRKGYSGTAIFTKNEPINVTYGMGIEAHDQEGRLITLEYDNYYLITVYTPNAKRDLTRLDYRLEWGAAFTNYIQQLDRIKPVIFCGDLNVAHQEIDLTYPRNNSGNSGFTQEEREDFSALLSNGFIDTYRALYPDRTGAYSWWSFQFNARQRNIGWRIDYFVTSQCLKEYIIDAKILWDVVGSDHCPVELKLAE
ncbi:exodeoxyribonuclease III [Sporolactobacillus shoreicorticis]|uniref:Exodeoxyribonuclease III n=1 Tax=Sporolactobacillus shoreicorticis TaxID=1923877 RepID=A0ABW5S7H6_9BACL|nr:exodeoxyribonuclease III [Sporolactobacillus shoreicorticis]MCO7126559.1 exodeoxyribonuclease III [Sporolactobacillus shoreicorticis]